jgi:two-component system OmpR family sensor kinase
VTVRARLLLGLLFLTALGLLVAGGVTYRQQHDFLYKQFNGELQSLTGPRSPVEPFLQESALQEQAEPLPSSTGIIAEIETRDGLQGSASTLSDPPQLPQVTSGTFTMSSPHYRGVAYTNVRGDHVEIALSLHEVDQTLHHLLFVEGVAFFAVLITLALLAWWVVNLGLRPIHEMEETAGKIADGDLSQRVEIVDENTEVGRLGLAFNQMLEQIEHAFQEKGESEERLRRFVADASHELRTPLTSIRGYAELFRRGAADRPEDLAKAMRRIEEEAGRMGVLVDDLLLLARLDQGRPLEEHPVDLTRITRDAVDDAHTVAPNRPIDYAPNGAIVVSGDEVRLRQVLANLMQNALRHTPPETPIHVRVESGDDTATIEVCDEGPGMSSEVAAHVFERFWRGDPSRQRASGGAGLGLAIVAAIADAHGGRAEVESEPGHGATFRVVLPRKHPSPPPTPGPAPAPNEVPVAELEPAPDA